MLSLNVLAGAEEPERALDECARVVKPGGDLLLVKVNKHDSMEIAAQFGHHQPGFTQRWLRKRLTARVCACAGVKSARGNVRPKFEVVTCLAQKE